MCWIRQVRAIGSGAQTIQTRHRSCKQAQCFFQLIGKPRAKGEDVSAIMAEVGALGDELKQLEAKIAGKCCKIWNAFLSIIPNTPHAGVPVGKSKQKTSKFVKWVSLRNLLLK